jgi:ABC-type antimicrobial peptide transport system permease subunit
MFEIVGVFRDFKMNNPQEAVRPVFLRAMTQRYSGYKEETMTTFEAESMYMESMVIDFQASPSNVDELIRRAVAEIDPNLTVMDVRSMDRQVAENFNQERLVARLTTLFGILALTLASVGLYGVTSYFVVRRTSEIGIRMALGAERSTVMRMVMHGAMTQIAIGLAIGVPAALIAGHFMASQLYQVRGYDPLALFGAVVLLTICAAVAGFIPALRAASTEPMHALRIE